MGEMTTLYTCLNCGRSEAETPVVALHYAGQPAWICTGCLPTLIHHPERLAGRLEGAEEIPSAPPDEH